MPLNRLKIIIPLFIITILTLAASPSITNFQSPISSSLNLIKRSGSLNLSKQSSYTPTLKIEQITNLGVPAGNASTPKHLALNSQVQQLYLLSEGTPLLKEGNGLSLYDIDRNQITDHIKINSGDNEALDLRFDPQNSYLYALSRPRSGATFTSTLTFINSQTFTTTHTLPGVEALAAGGGQLYTMFGDTLIAYTVTERDILPTWQIILNAGSTGPMVVSPNTNRLYVARNSNGQWLLEILEADSLVPVETYRSASPILDILPLPSAEELLLVIAQNNLRAITRLTTDGQLVADPIELGPGFGAAGIALSNDEQALYYSNGQLAPLSPADPSPGPALIGVTNSIDLTPQQNIPLPTNFDALAINDQTEQAFALYPFTHALYVIDLEDETFETVPTAIELKDVLFEASNNQLYVSDTANRVRIFEADTLDLVTENTLESNATDYGFNSVSWSGELALDTDRNRLYVSGLPAVVLEADTLADVELIEPGGQLAPDPTTNNIYVSHCGVTILNAGNLRGDTELPGSGQRGDGLSPDPCAGYSQLDVQNQLLYSLVPNGVPGSNSGNYLYLYDLAVEPSLILSDTTISVIRVEPEATDIQAFVNTVRNSNYRLRTLDVPNSEYSQQLLGVWGDPRYSSASNRLYLGHKDYDRLLTLNAKALSVVDELALPRNYNYRLVDIDPATERLFLIGLDGQLLVASADDALTGVMLDPVPPREPNGKIQALESTSSGDILARIEANYDNNFNTRLYRTTDEGQNWLDLSKNLPLLPAQTVAVSDNEAGQETLFAGLLVFGQAGGLYQSTDSGQSWTPAMAGLQDMWLEELYISPDFAESGLIFAKTTYGGLHYSSDGGQNWQPLNQADPNAFFPSSTQNSTVAFAGQGKILVSQSNQTQLGIYEANLQPNGKLSSWKQVLDQPVSLMTFSPDGPVALAYGEGLWRSVDGGRHWQATGTGLDGVENLRPDRFIFSPDFAQDDTVYFFFKDAGGGSPAILFRSTDGGQQWQPWFDPQPDGNSYTALTLTPEGDFILGDTQTQLTRLAPAELHWVDATIQIASDESLFPIHSLAASPNFASDQTLFALSSEHGLFKSSNGGQQWQLTDFPARSYRVISPNPYRLTISPNYADDETLFVATGRSLHRSVDGGKSWEQLQPVNTLSFAAQHVALSPNFDQDKTALTSVAGQLYRSTNGGDTWQPVLDTEGVGGNTDLLAIAPAGETAYVRFGYGGQLYTSRDGGKNWQAPTSNRDEFFSLLSSDLASDNTLTGVMEFDKRLMQTSPQSPPWAEISQTLPAELANLKAIVYTPADTLVIGGQGGIFTSPDNGETWQSLNGNLPAETNVSGLYNTSTHLFATLTDGTILVTETDDIAWNDISVVQ